MNIFPSQKLPLKEKLTRDKQTGRTWGENCVKYLIDSSDWSDVEELHRLKRIADGEIDDRDYDYVLNPFNTQIENYKRFGAKLQNFNILGPVRDLYLGEFGKRFKNVQVIDANPDDDNLYKEGLNLVVKNYYTQKAINELNSLGIDTGKDSQDQGKLQEVIEAYKKDFDTNKVATGQETLDFLRFDKELDDVYQDVYSDWITTGRAITYKGIFYNDIDFEHVPSEELSFPKGGNSNFIEDKAWAVRRKIVQPHELLDTYGEFLSDDDKDWLHSKLESETTGLGSSPKFVVMPTQYVSAKDFKSSRIGAGGIASGIELFHVVWRSWRKVGILNFIDELGQANEMEVDETYKIDKTHGDISIEWNWISQVWEGYCAEDERFFGIRPLPYNRMELNNSGKQKLPYNGRVMISATGKPKSIIKVGEPYQLLYNVAHYQFEKVMNKNKDKITVLPQGLIPKGKAGWDEEKFMYYAHANSLMIIDETSPTAALALQGIKVLDMSLGQYIKEMQSVMLDIKSEWWDAIGMNRQRFGDTNSSDGKAVNEQAIFRSAIISEELNRKFEKFQERDYEGLLDLSKLAYINGKKGKYVNSDQREALLSINPDDANRRLGTDFNIYVRNSSTEQEKLDILQQYAFSYAQNDRDPSLLMEMLDATNFTKAKARILQIEEVNKRRAEAMEEQKIASAEKMEESRRASEQAKNDVEIYKADRDYDKTIDGKLLDINGNGADRDGEDIVEDQEARRMNNHKIKVDNEKIQLDKEEQKRKQKETNAKVKHMANKVN